MELLGTHVPVSWSALAILVVGGAVAVAAGGGIARLLGWRARPTKVTLALVGAVLALTTPPGNVATAAPDRCMPEDLARLWVEPLHMAGGAGGALLNFVLFAPLGLAVVLASGRARSGVAAVLLLPTVIEAVQEWVPGRTCSFSDYAANVVGGVAGVILGVLVVRRRSPAATGRQR